MKWRLVLLLVVAMITVACSNTEADPQYIQTQTNAERQAQQSNEIQANETNHHEIQQLALNPEDQTNRLIVNTTGQVDFSNLGTIEIEEFSEDIKILIFASFEDAKEAYEYLRTLENVAWVEFDLYLPQIEESVFPLEVMTFTEGYMSWGAKRINVSPFIDYLRQTERANEEIIVAVLDTGVDANHPSLRGRVLPGWNTIRNNADARDDHGHGTHVAGIITDATLELNVQILPIKVLDRDGRGSNSHLAQGVRWAVENGADVINLSLGSFRSNHVDEIVLWAVAMGVTVVAAAGNESVNAGMMSPAGSVGALTVASVDANDNPSVFGRGGGTNWGTAVNIAAPGSEINSTLPDGRFGADSGTSMAAPHVSAAVAMYKILNPDISPAAVKRNFAMYVDVPSGWNNERYGAGILNLDRAVPSRPAPTPTPTPDIVPVETPAPVQMPEFSLLSSGTVEFDGHRYPWFYGSATGVLRVEVETTVKSNVFLIDEENFLNYLAGRSFYYYGGEFEAGSINIRVRGSQRFYLVVSTTVSGSHTYSHQYFRDGEAYIPTSGSVYFNGHNYPWIYSSENDTLLVEVDIGATSRVILLTEENLLKYITGQDYSFSGGIYDAGTVSINVQGAGRFYLVVASRVPGRYSFRYFR